MMKKYIWINLLLIMSCGSRKVATQISKVASKVATSQDLSVKTDTSTKSESTFDFASLAENQNFSIAGGTPYKLNYNGIIYEGSSPIEISNNKVNTRFKTVVKTETITKTNTTYKTHTNYKSVTTYKNKDTDRKSYPFWLWIAVGFLLKILVGFAWSSFKGSNAYLKIIEKIKP